MKAKKSRLNIAVCSVITAAILSLSACTTSSQNISSAQAFGNLNLNQKEYADLVNNVNDSERFNALILLMRSSVNAGDAKLARDTLNEIYSLATDPYKQTQAQILEALLNSRTGKLEQAYSELKNINAQALPESTAAYYYQLRSAVSGKMFNKNISKQKLFFRQITLNQFIIHASKDLITILLFI